LSLHYYFKDSLDNLKNFGGAKKDLEVHQYAVSELTIDFLLVLTHNKSTH